MSINGTENRDKKINSKILVKSLPCIYIARNPLLRGSSLFPMYMHGEKLLQNLGTENRDKLFSLKLIQNLRSHLNLLEDVALRVLQFLPERNNTAPTYLCAYVLVETVGQYLQAKPVG